MLWDVCPWSEGEGAVGTGRSFVCADFWPLCEIVLVDVLHKRLDYAVASFSPNYFISFAWWQVLAGPLLFHSSQFYFAVLLLAPCFNLNLFFLYVWFGSYCGFSMEDSGV